MSPKKGIRFQITKGSYFNGDSMIPDETTSKSLTYPTHLIPKTNAKLQ